LKHFRSIRYLLLIILLPVMLLSTGTVYLVLGSDTAIWEGMSTNRYNDTYNLGLYTDPLRNAYTVMDPAFRAQFLDSYGQSMKMTWWMMAGNIFRYATNNDVPVPNIMTLYLMKKYHGENVINNGDELSLHYHTFFWSDYDRDGMYYWNQALSFEESKDDWDVTLAQFLLEEDVFPVSFRSGWHYMDNAWQHELNNVLPYSMHNAWPSNRVDTEEPLDNTYNWSESPSEFVPFRPSLDNYMVDGDGPGWNVRSASFQHVRNSTLMDDVFSKANDGVDQVACFWAHLPETDFPENMALMDQLAHEAALKYPNVNFRYCTAIEAMQLWRGTVDTTGPVVTIEEKGTSAERYYILSSDEPLFMPQPFVAVKYKDESYQVIDCEQVTDMTWRTNIVPFASELAKIGLAATDTSGNLSSAFISYVPDDIYIDNLDAGYTEYAGDWNSSTDVAWGTDSRITYVSAVNPAHVGWETTISQEGTYKLSYQVPEAIDNEVTQSFIIHSATGPDTVYQQTHQAAYEWIYLGTYPLSAGTYEVLELASVEPYPIGTGSVVTDVVKISAMIRDKDLRISSNILNFGEVGLEQPTSRTIELENRGIQDLSIHNITSRYGNFDIDLTTPLLIEGMGKIDLSLSIQASNLGLVSDTLTILSDDPMHPSLDILVTADVRFPFVIVDNEDGENYAESGEWFTSVAQIWGNSSRYAYLNNGVSASFTREMDLSGTYDVLEIVPRTVNSADSALYVIKIDGIAIDSVFKDQNAGSGEWVSLGQYYLPKEVPIQVEVHDTGLSTVGPVLRADAVRFQMLTPNDLDPGKYAEWMPSEPVLQQNYPNPFNPSTTIRYSLPVESRMTLEIFDVMGREILSLREDSKPAGQYELVWNGLDQAGNEVSTGVYFCRLQSANFSETIKMVFLR